MCWTGGPFASTGEGDTAGAGESPVPTAEGPLQKELKGGGSWTD